MKFSMRSTTHDVISLLKLSKICLVEAACAAVLFADELISLGGVVLWGEDLSSGG